MNSEQRKNTILILFLIFVILIAVTFIGYKYFRVVVIDINGNSKIEDDYIVELSGIKINQNMFTISEEKLKNNINSDSYLEYFDMKRIYPSTISIEVYERTPVAQIAFDDGYIFIDEKANILQISDFEQSELLLVLGVGVEEAKTGQKIELNNYYEFDILRRMINQANFDLLCNNVYSVDMSDINNITMYTDSRIVIKFGDSEKMADKITWIDAVMKKLNEKEITQGTINVTTGTNATYKR